LLYGEQTRFAEAEALLRRALAIDERSFGADHPEVATDLNNLASLLQATNRLGEAEPLMRRAVAIPFGFTRRTGHQHPNLQVGLANLRGLLEALGRPEADIQAALATPEEPTP
jgi:Tetratricopeptide repeat